MEQHFTLEKMNPAQNCKLQFSHKQKAWTGGRGHQQGATFYIRENEPSAKLQIALSSQTEGVVREGGDINEAQHFTLEKMSPAQNCKLQFSRKQKAWYRREGASIIIGILKHIWKTFSKHIIYLEIIVYLVFETLIITMFQK